MLRVGNRVVTAHEALDKMDLRQLRAYRKALAEFADKYPRYQLKVRDIDQEIEWRAAHPGKTA
jgi:hypothetical protein